MTGFWIIRRARIGIGHRRRAIVAVQVAVFSAVLAGFAALSVDVGYLYNLHGEMQAAVDAGALAGATAAPNGQDATAARATSATTENWLSGSQLTAQEVVVQVGYWNANGNSFTLPTGAEAAAPNAARVVGARPGISLFFARIFHETQADVQRDAIAVYGSGRCAGIWGLESIDAGGNIQTDSYIASDGAYGPGNTYLNGDICSQGDIDLDGSVTIGGDAMYGDGYGIDISGNAYTVNGVIAEHNTSVVVPTIDMVAASNNNDNATIGLTDVRNRDPFDGTQWDLIGVTGQDTLTLNGGTYYLTSAVIEGGAQIVVTAPTIFYIDGPATFKGGGIINATGNPANLVIYSTGATMEIAGGADFYGVIIAPTTTVTFTGSSDIYGTIMAGILQLPGDSFLHIDEDVVQQFFGVAAVASVLVE